MPSMELNVIVDQWACQEKMLQQLSLSEKNMSIYKSN